MVEAREQVEWNRASSMMVNARLAFHNPDRVRIVDLIPKKYHPKERELTEEQKRFESQKNWFLFAQAMFKGQ